MEQSIAILPPSNERTEKFHYLPVSEEMHAWECFITTVGRGVYGPGENYPHRGHPSVYNFDWKSGRILPEYMIVLVVEGRGIYEVAKGDTQKCTAGDVLQFAPGQWHRYRSAADSGWTELWLGLGGEYLHRLREKQLAFIQPHVCLGREYPAVREALMEVIRATDANATLNTPLLASAVIKIIALIAQASQAGKPTPEQPEMPVGDARLSRALEFIWTNSHRPIRVADVAAAAAMNTRAMERLFAAMHKCSVRQEIEWSRFFRAQRLLRNTRMPIKEIAYTCGFGDPRRMFEVFRRRQNMTPNEMRGQA